MPALAICQFIQSFCLFTTIILEKFTSQNFQFKIIQPKNFSPLKVIDENFMGKFFRQCNNSFARQMRKIA